MIYTFVKTNLQAVMTDRLQVILQREGITAAKFASALGVQPSALSHLLSGRNKPSYDFITRFIMAYPAYNIEWLLVGKQPMLKEALTQSANSVPTATTIDEPQTLFIANDESAEVAPQAQPAPQPLPQHSVMAQAATPQPGSQSTTAPQTTPQPSAPVQPAPQPSSIISATETVAPQQNNTNAQAQVSPQPTSSAAKSPRKVIILYDDHTFESFEYLK